MDDASADDRYSVPSVVYITVKIEELRVKVALLYTTYMNDFGGY